MAPACNSAVDSWLSSGYRSLRDVHPAQGESTDVDWKQDHGKAGFQGQPGMLLPSLAVQHRERSAGANLYNCRALSHLPLPEYCGPES